VAGIAKAYEHIAHMTGTVFDGTWACNCKVMWAKTVHSVLWLATDWIGGSDLQQEPSLLFVMSRPTVVATKGFW